jgi:hypothetical protein
MEHAEFRYKCTLPAGNYDDVRHSKICLTIIAHQKAAAPGAPISSAQLQRRITMQNTLRLVTILILAGLITACHPVRRFPDAPARQPGTQVPLTVRPVAH